MAKNNQENSGLDELKEVVMDNTSRIEAIERDLAAIIQTIESLKEASGDKGPR